MRKHGKKSKTGRTRRVQRTVSNHADTHSMAKTTGNRGKHGSEPLGSDGENDKAANTRQKEEYIGKILSQLRELREAHLAYVNAHSDRLRARLAEDDAHRSHILEGMDALEQEILSIQAEQESDALDEEG